MRIKAALLCAALAAPPLQAQESAATAADARAVIAAVLAQEVAVRGPEGAAQTCVAAPFAGSPPPPGAEEEMIPDHAVRIRFQWHVPDAAAPVRAAPPPPVPGERNRRRAALPPTPAPAPLAPDLAERLNTLRAEAARAAAPPAIAQIDASAVPAPLSLQRPSDDCALLTLSAPAFAGDAAFVALGYACGTVCGNGGLYALQRREGRWELVAIADIWIR
jgi:hypothetical protein